jgi:two-component system nitrogen regulation response regulator NtrX
MITILVVDDVAAMAEQYAYDLQRLGRYDTQVANSGETALDILATEAVDCLILDLEMPGADGFDVLRRMKEKGLEVPVIVYTGTGSYDRCIQAVRLGAYGFIDKTEPMERVIQEIEGALERRQLRTEVRALTDRLGADWSLIGDSPAMRAVKDQITRLATIPSPVLIEGESGSGKELVARDLHQLRVRDTAASERHQPFIAINCAALPENLVESELFGHERGAFTGANRLRKGAFEEAGSGTLFLDEIGELPLPVQAKLLRVLEQREVSRLGGSRTVPVRARVVAATNRDLEREASEGRFRQDLLFRLNVHTIRVPPLRERQSDIPELIEHFLAGTCARFGIARKRMTPEAVDALSNHDWSRNNVRELRNIVERMIIAADGNTIEIGHVPADVTPSSPMTSHVETGMTFQDLRTESERQIVRRALDRHDWHITNTAEDLGLADHASLLKIMRRLGISRPE